MARFPPVKAPEAPGVSRARGVPYHALLAQQKRSGKSSGTTRRRQIEAIGKRKVSADPKQIVSSGKRTKPFENAGQKQSVSCIQYE